MRHAIVTLIFVAVSSATAAELPASIERVKTGDPAMSCAQTYSEIGNLDQVIAQASASEQHGNTTAVVADTAGKVSESPALGAVPFGGLFGKIIGGIAKNKAQGAGDIGRQAQARKEHLSTLAANKGCKDSDPAYEPPANAKPIAAPKAAPATSVTISTALPDVNASEYFDGKNGGTFGAKTIETLPKNKRVAIAGFRVVFVTFNSAYARATSTYMPGGAERGAAHSTIEVTLDGVDEATMQALTDQAYATFVAQMKLAGREIVPAEQLQTLWSTMELAQRSNSKEKGLAFSPQGIPLWWQNGEQWGDTSPFNQTNMRALGAAAPQLNAIVIAPVLVVDFARMESSGSHSWGSADVSANLLMSVRHFHSRVLRSEESRSGMVAYGKGEDGTLDRTKAIATEMPFAEMVKTSEAKGGLMSLNVPGLNVLGSKTSKSSYLAKTTPVNYSNAAITVLTQATGIFAKLFKENPAP